MLKHYTAYTIQEVSGDNSDKFTDEKIFFSRSSNINFMLGIPVFTVSAGQGS